MEDCYDVIVLGSDITTSILAGLLSARGKRVLLVDKNNYYGGENASYNLVQLFRHFCPDKLPPPVSLGSNRQWNIDLIPKVAMVSGQMSKVLEYTKTHRYMDWRAVDAYVMQASNPDINCNGVGPSVHKVSITDLQLDSSDLLSIEQRDNFKAFLQLCRAYDTRNPAYLDINIKVAPFASLASSFSLEPDTIDLIVHTIALYSSETCLDIPAEDVVLKIKQYCESASVIGESPFQFPIYGLSSIPEAFSRFTAIHGGTFMLGKPVDKILFDATGRVSGIKSEADVYKAPIIISDSSYTREIGKVRAAGQVIRAICIIDHPIPHTEASDALFIILPHRQTLRHNDIYIVSLGSNHCICCEGFWVVTCSTVVETTTPEAELQSAYDLLGPVLHSFVTVYDTYEPLEDGLQDGLFITKGRDATTLLDKECEDVLSLYSRVTGEPLDYTETRT